MTDQNTFDYKIAMIGPERVGKTSLITAILEESQKTLLAGTNIIIEPVPGKTEARINRYKSQLRSTLKTETEFTPEVVEGSQEEFTYFLDMKGNYSGLKKVSVF